MCVSLGIVCELYIQIKVDFLGICGSLCGILEICIIVYKYVCLGIDGDSVCEWGKWYKYVVIVYRENVEKV